MNIFVTDPDPNVSAQVLPDKHVVKMPLETCQMLAVVFSKWYYNWGNDLLPKKDGTPYNTEKGAFRGHPCTIWAAESVANTAWLIQHGFALLNEYETRYGKIHSCATLPFFALYNTLKSESILCANQFADSKETSLAFLNPSPPIIRIYIQLIGNILALPNSADDTLLSI